jgi:hypothetical protein
VEAADYIDYIAIRRVQSAYADIVSRRAWPELATIFLPDTEVEIDKMSGEPLRLVGPTAVGEFIGGAIAGFDFFQFVVLNTVIDIGRDGGQDVGSDGDPDVATTRMYMNELRREAESGRFTVVYGLYQDRMRRVGGRWWFAQRKYQTLARSAHEFDVFPFPALTNWSDVVD